MQNITERLVKDRKKHARMAEFDKQIPYSVVLV
jgi:hypothetical protein